MADDDNTEQLRLDTTQANTAVDSLTAKLKQVRAALDGLSLPLRGITQSVDRISQIKPFDAITKGAKESVDRIGAVQQAIERMNVAASGPASNIAASRLPPSYSAAQRLLLVNPSSRANNPLFQGPQSVFTPNAQTMGGIAASMQALGVAIKGPVSILGSFTSSLNKVISSLQNNVTSLFSGGGANSGLAGGKPVVGGGSSYLGLAARRFATYGAIGAGVAGAGLTINEVLGLDTAMHNLQAITVTSDTGMAKLRTSIIDVATSSKFMSTEVAGAAVTLAQAGLSADQVGTALKAVVQLAEASGSDLQSTVTIITSAMGAFDLAAGSAETVANLFTAALNNSKLTMDQLSQGFSYSANAASQLGVGFEDLTATLAALSNAGIKGGTTLGTGLRALFVDFTDMPTKLVATLARLHISVDDVSLQSKSLADVFLTLRAAGFTAADAFSSLQTRAAATYVAFLGQLDTFPELQRNMIATAAAAKAADTQMGSLANTAKNTASIFTALISTGLQPTIAMFQSVLAGTNSAAQGFVDANTGIQLVTTSLTIMLGVLAAWKVATLLGVGSLAALGALATPILVIGGISVALAGLIQYLNAGKVAQDKFNAAVEDAKGANEAAQNSYDNVQHAIGDLIAKEESLRSNKEELKTKTVELGAQFRKLGLDVNDLGLSYDDLLRKMQDVRTTSGATLLAALNVSASARNLAYGGERLGIPAVMSQAQALTQPSYTQAGEGDVQSIPAPDFSKVAPDQSNLAKLLAKVRRGDSLEGSANWNLIQNSNSDLDKAKTNGAAGSAVDNLSKMLELLTKKFGALAEMIGQSDMAKNLLAIGAASNDPTLLDYKSKADAIAVKDTTGYRRKPGDDAVATQSGLQAWKATITKDAGDLKLQLDALVNRSSDPDSKSAMATAIAQDASFTRLSEIAGRASTELADNRPAADKAEAKTADQQLFFSSQDYDDAKKVLAAAKDPAALASAAADLLAKANAVYGASLIDYGAKQGLHITLAKGYGIGALPQSVAGGEGHDVTASDQKDIKYHAEGLADEFGGGSQDLIKTKTDEINLKLSKDTIAGYEATVSALNEKMRDAFKNVDQYTTESDMAALIKQEQANLVLWYAAQLKILNEKLSDGQFSQDEYNTQLGALNSERSSKQDENTARTKTEQYNTSRPSANINDAFSQIGKAFQDPTEDPSKNIDQFATTFKDSMVAAITSVKDSLGGLFTQFETGSITAGNLFKSLAKSILTSMLQVINNKIAAQFLSLVGSFLPGGPVDETMPTVTPEAAGLKGGGYVRRAGGGGDPVSTRDSVPTLLQPGEFVMRQSATAAIGRENLQMLNAMGNSHVSQSNVKPMTPSAPSLTNVYVVQQDRQPQMGPNDILVAVANDILRGGQTKQLIKSVAAGH